jgi:hypothetical protein
VRGVQQQYAGQVQDAVTKLQQLLGATAQERAFAGQTYTQGQSQAALDAYNALLASGAIHAAKPPNWAVGSYRIRRPAGPPRHPAPGGGGGGGIPPVAVGPGGGGIVGQPPPFRPPGAIPTPPRPTTANAGLNPPPPGGVTQQPLDMQAALRRYGIYT